MTNDDPRLQETAPDPAPAAIAQYLTGAVVDNAVSLVTSAYGERRNVMTVSFFAESSHVPPLVRVSIARTTLTHELIERSGRFGVSLLCEGQEALAIACGTTTGRHGNKFDVLRLPFLLGDHGLPLLTQCLTTSECLVVDRVGLPTHTMFVGEIVSSYRQSSLAYKDTLLVSHLLHHLGDTSRDRHAR